MQVGSLLSKWLVYVGNYASFDAQWVIHNMKHQQGCILQSSEKADVLFRFYIILVSCFSIVTQCNEWVTQWVTVSFIETIRINIGAKGNKVSPQLHEQKVYWLLPSARGSLFSLPWKRIMICMDPLNCLHLKGMYHFGLPIPSLPPSVIAKITM